MFFMGILSACKQQPGNTAVPILGSGAGIQQNSDVDRLLSDSRSELSRLNQEAKANKDQISDLEKKINDLSGQLKTNQDLTAEQKRTLEAELAALKKQRDDLEAQLKTLADKQAATQKELEEAKKQASNSGSQGTSGFPFCGSLYYGIEFDCNGRKCGKSDPQYLNTCEITPNSRPATANGASGYPFCGAVYYGTEFDCNGKKCGKSDAQYQNICEITVNSKPSSGSTSTSTQNGSSGYPLCGAVYYGMEFDCNGKKCGKSDSQYKNICEITANSKPSSPSSSTSLGVSGYPYCPSPRYGMDFDCNNGRRCAKSDPEYKNICEIK
jgi:regulator of replication initiation timing